MSISSPTEVVSRESSPGTAKEAGSTVEGSLRRKSGRSQEPWPRDHMPGSQLISVVISTRTQAKAVQPSLWVSVLK